MSNFLAMLGYAVGCAIHFPWYAARGFVRGTKTGLRSWARQKTFSRRMIQLRRDINELRVELSKLADKVPEAERLDAFVVMDDSLRITSEAINELSIPIMMSVAVARKKAELLKR